MGPSLPIHGRGASHNPPNRFDTLAVEREDWVDAEDPSPRTTFYRDASKDVISTNDSPDVGFDVGINAYRGCEHGCVYCFARPYHEYLGFSAGLDFETKIVVKEDAPALLRKRLASPRWEPKPLMMSGATDPYQPAERRFRITRGILEVLADFRHPVGIITKNHLVTRDEADPAQTKIIEKWDAIAAPLASRVVGSVAEDITGDESTCRCEETPMGDLVAEVADDLYLRKWGAPGTPPPDLQVKEFRALARAVAVSDPLAVRARRVRVLVAFGLQEGAFPPAPRPEPFLSDEARRELARHAGLVLPRCAEEALGAERYLFYALASRPEERLVLAWHTGSDDGEPAVRSFFVDDVCDLFDPSLEEGVRRRGLGAVAWADGEEPTPREAARSAATRGPRHRPRPLGP
ncbi:MAG: hypothetical protein KY453_06180, partial [Gemmatimonadetes bacterium]|nr:hypothetical protein [Gemmatimonadota bacterium]